MPKRTHVHRYMRTPLKNLLVWRCADAEGCDHFMPPAMEALLVGRKSRCWGCGKTFLLDEDAMKDDQPKCMGCMMGESQTPMPDLSEYIRVQEILAKAGVKSVDELGESKIRNIEMLTGIDLNKYRSIRSAKDDEVQIDLEDKPEIIEPEDE